MSVPLKTVRGPDAGVADLRRVLQAVLKGRVVAEPLVDWSRLLHLAQRHQLDAFLFDAVAAWPTDCRPSPDILAAWQRQQRVRAVEAVRNQAQRATLLAALQAAHVPAIPLKGSWLAEQVYADIVQRPMSDIDLLIRPEQADAAFAVMAQLGYRPMDTSRPGDWGKEQVFCHPEWRCPIELQWQLWHPTHGLLPPQDMGRLWTTATHSKIADVEVLVLALAAHLVYLTYHIQAHQWRFPVRAHLDLVLLGRRHAQNLTTDALSAEARTWGLEFRAPFVWRVAHDICGVEPPAALSGWNAGESEEIRRTALVVAFPGSSGHVTMSRLLCEYRQASTWRQRLTLGLKAIRISPDNLRYAHPMATRWGGLAGGYMARVSDLLGRRIRDLMPIGRRRTVVAAAVEDMSVRLRLERWLKLQEK